MAVFVIPTMAIITRKNNTKQQQFRYCVKNGITKTNKKNANIQKSSSREYLKTPISHNPGPDSSEGVLSCKGFQ
jgi:hypothetical protein